MMLRSMLAGLLVLMAASIGRTQEPISFARSPDISPDGRQIVFSYKGDIWIVDAIGGVARPVTMHEAHDIAPCFSPDGRSIAFSSNRHGSYDVFVVSALGGRPKRLTFDSGNEAVTGWTPDGKAVLYSASRGDEFPTRADMYKIDVSGGREQRMTTTEARQGVMSPDGTKIAYVRGPGFSFRKGYRGSANDDIWICQADGSAPSRFTDFSGEDTSPMWAPDARTLYYVSECLGTPANIVRQRVDSAKPELLTDHKTDAVRLARISRDGNWIVYECGADLWIVPAAGGTPRKLAIEVHADDKDNGEQVLTLSQGVSEYAMSTDERSVAFTIMGELFIVPTSGGKANRLTDRAANDHAPVWSPDGKKLVFSSDVGGFEDLYLLESDDAEHPALSRAHKFKQRRLTVSPEAEVGASFSPDGKKIAFLRSGQLWTMDPDGSNAKELVKEGSVFDYDWSPDGRNIVFARRDASFASDLYIISSAGGQARNITRYGTMHEDVSWSRRGGKIAFISERRRNEPSMFVLSLQKPSPPDALASPDIDWDDIHLRVTQPSTLQINEGAISTDGTRVAFRATSHNGEDLWVAAADGSSLTRLTNGNLRPQQIHWSRLVPDLIFFRDRMGQIRFSRAGMPNLSDPRAAGANVEPGKIPFTAKLTVRRDEQFLEMFDQSCRLLSESFYDPNFRGLDWQGIRAKYRPLVKHVALREDFYSLVNLMFGELNVSHVALQAGARPATEEPTADLGLLFDPAYTGPGLRIQEILKRGPADRRGLTLKAGEVVTAIDGKVIDSKTNVAQVLNGKVKETVVVEVSANPGDPAARRRVEIEAVGRAAIADLMYNRWVDQNAARVNQLSKGQLGYIHIKAMDEDSLEKFVRALYGENFDKQGLILDVRFNSGGFTHDQILSYLGGREHTVFRRRDGAQGLVMRSFDRKWTKPIVLLINSRSYSDAEILPNAFRVLGLGKLVGESTGGHVLGTTSTRLIDGSRLQLPQIGIYTNSGLNLEMAGVQPDFAVEAKPDQLARGNDVQITKAVEVLGAEVVARQAAATKVAQQAASAAKTAPTSAGTAIK